MAPEGPDLLNLPILVRGRLLGTILVSIAFLISIWLNIAPRQVLIPLYMAANFVLVVTFAWIDMGRLGAYMKANFPEEYRRIVPRENEYGFRSALLSWSGNAELLAQIKRRSRRVWVKQLWMLPLMLLVIVVGVEVSK